MGTYGRNFEFLVPPVHGQRGSRYSAPTGADLPIGAPVKVADGATPDAGLGLLPVALATGAQAIPKQGLGGIIVYEWLDYRGTDPELTTYSDRDYAPRGRAVQVVSGKPTKVMLKNTVARTFMHSRDYPGRVMVAGLGATLTLAVGDMLTPGTGNDTAGYWAETGTAANAWLIVERVDNARGLVEARFNF